MSLVSKFTAWSTRPDVWRPLLLLMFAIALLRIAMPALELQGLALLAGVLRHDEWALDKRTSSFLPLIRHVQERVPADEAILIDLEPGVAPLYWDRVVNYWLYPRKVYSVKALELHGEDVDAFARRHRIRWFYADGELKHRGRASPPPVDPPELPCSLHRTSRARVALGLAAALAHFGWVGACILAALGATAALPSRLERWAASFLVGAGGVGAWALLCFVTGVGVSLPSIALSLPLATAAAWWWRRDAAGVVAAPGKARPRRRTSDLDWLAGVAALLLLAFFVAHAAALPMEGYDDRYQWAHKAHIMLHEQSLWGDGFQDPQTLHFHPRYPVLVPGMEAVVFLYAGGFNDQYPKVLFPLFLAAFLVLLVRGAEDLGRGRGRTVAALALVAMPFYAGYDLERDGAAAYPDLPLSVFAATAMLYLLRGSSRNAPALTALSAVFVLLTALTKSEGVVHASVLATMGVTLVWRTACEREAARRSVLPLLPFALAVAAIALHQLLVVLPTQPGIIPDDYPALLLSQPVTGHLDRLGDVLGRLAAEFFTSPRFGYLGLLLLVAAAFWRPAAGIAPLLPLAYGFGLALLFCVPYLLLPDHRWEDIYTWSAGRLIAQLLPMGLLAVALLVLPPRECPAEEEPARTG